MMSLYSRVRSLVRRVSLPGQSAFGLQALALLPVAPIGLLNESSAFALVFVLPSLGTDSRDVDSGALDVSRLQDVLIPLGEDTSLTWGAEGAFAREPFLSDDPRAPSDGTFVGFGEATLIAHNRWATVRYLGENPAGLGLVGSEFSSSVKDALGAPNDIVPVTTAAHTIQRMMADYFVPLLSSLPGGKAVLDSIHVNGAYFSPTFNPRDGWRLDYDNAFIVGGQTLHIYPSSCFHRPDVSSCKVPFLTTGHDATVIGHELGHVIYNRIQGMQSPRGYQWFAVNEGYADYFSASFFETPEIGNAWQNGRSNAPYLRRLTDYPGTRDPDVLASFHEYSRIWSGLLWEIRSNLVARDKALVRDFDRVVLMSQFHLGEGGGNRLGDAARALVKASYELGHVELDPLLRKALSERGIEIVAEDFALVEEDERETSHFGCSTPRSTKTPTSTGENEPVREHDLGLAVLAVGPFGLMFRRLRVKGKWSERRIKGSLVRMVALLFSVAWLMASCIKRKAEARVGDMFEMGPERVTYTCEVRSLAGVSGPKKTERIVIAPANPLAEAKGDLRLILFEESRESVSEAIQVLVDSRSRRLDRALRLDGKALKGALGLETVEEEQAARMAKLSLAMMLFEQGPQAALAKLRAGQHENSKTGSAAPEHSSDSGARILFTSTGDRLIEARFHAPMTQDDLSSPQELFASLPEQLSLDGTVLCSRE